MAGEKGHVAGHVEETGVTVVGGVECWPGEISLSWLIHLAY